MKTSPSCLRRVCLLAILLLIPFEFSCRAGTIYSFTIDTTVWSGQNGKLAFDLTGGDAAVANNTAAISALATNGTLSGAASFSLTDTFFFNEVLRDITFGTSLSFILELSENRAPPGVDQFSFFVLNSLTGLPLGGTTDPTGADALFAIDINGRDGGSASVFAPSAMGPSWYVNNLATEVPDGGSTLALALISSAIFLGSGLRRILRCPSSSR